MKTKIMLSLLLALPAAAAQAEPVQPEAAAPAYIPAGRPALDELTSGLRARLATLGRNGLPGPAGGKVSRALLLLPRDRARPGALSFQLEKGKRAGLYQCEALGRGITGKEPRPRWKEGLIAGVTIYYTPKDMSGGATVPGVYDLLNISPERYDLHFFGKPEDAPKLKARDKKMKKGEKRLFSAVWPHWYPSGAKVMPVDMLWAADSQAGSQGQGVPVFDIPPQELTAEESILRARQLAANPRYYTGPYGRYGFAVHTDRWEDLKRIIDPAVAGRPEISDFRWRDTNGCVKLRPACLKLLNKFIDEQEELGRRVQLEVYETPLLDGLPEGGAAAAWR
ncbi:MAG TPA: hypothetical protein DEQ38_07655 [Elusimicrobia bacterium]|nr:hypothetical protein [Elusimicrobiota bacterium]